MTENQLRAMALRAAQYQLRKMKCNPVDATAQEAYQALGEYVRLYPNMYSSQWYRTANYAGWQRFCKDWYAWRQRQWAVLSHESHGEARSK